MVAAADIRMVVVEVVVGIVVNTVAGIVGAGVLEGIQVAGTARVAVVGIEHGQEEDSVAADKAVVLPDKFAVIPQGPRPPQEWRAERQCRQSCVDHLVSLWWKRRNELSQELFA